MKNQTDAINSKPKKMLSQFEISQLSFKNEKLSEEVKSLKAQIVNLNDKINEQLVTITNIMKQKFQQILNKIIVIIQIIK